MFHMFSFIAEEKNMAYDGYMLFFMSVNLYALINENEWKWMQTDVNKCKWTSFWRVFHGQAVGQASESTVL